MEKKTINQTTLVDQLRKLKKDETIVFPICKLISVRSTIARLKFIYETMRFSCKVDPDVKDQTRTFTVTRIR